MGKNYILALVLMIVVMIAWSLFFGNRFAPQPEESATTEQTPAPSSPSEMPIDPATQATVDAPKAPIDPDLWTAIEESPDDTMVNVRTGKYSIVFNEKLAIAKEWRLNHFPDRVDAERHAVESDP